MICKLFSVHTAMDKQNLCLFIDFYQRLACHFLNYGQLYINIYRYREPWKRKFMKDRSVHSF